MRGRGERRLGQQASPRAAVEYPILPGVQIGGHPDTVAYSSQRQYGKERLGWGALSVLTLQSGEMGSQKDLTKEDGEFQARLE